MNDEVLTAKQEEIVKAESNELLIRGIAGSGKTLVILRKAKQIAEANPRKKVAIFTYNRTLKASADYQIGEFGLNNLEVNTFHSWAYGALASVGKRPYVLDNKKIKEIVSKGIEKKIPKENRFREVKYIDFVMDEIGWIKGMGIETKKSYIDISRAGRGSDVRLSKEDRNMIYGLFEYYQKSKGIKWDYNDYAIELNKSKCQIDSKYKYDIVFVDEAQDLQMIQLKLLRELTQQTFIVAADKGQKIYTSSFTWKDIGLNITGGRTKILDETFRSTKPIVELARSMQMNDIIKKDEEFIECQLPDINGVKPMWYRCNDYSSMTASILKLVEKIDVKANSTIGVLSREWRVLDKLLYHFKSNGYYTEKIEGNKGNAHTPGIKLTTYHSAKGLEFDYVIMVANKPNNKTELDLNVERRLYYVSMTRAKAALYIFSEQEYPDILNELDGKLYRLKELI